MAPSGSVRQDLRPGLREGQRGHRSGQRDAKAPEARVLSFALKGAVEIAGPGKGTANRIMQGLVVPARSQQPVQTTSPRWASVSSFLKWE